MLPVFDSASMAILTLLPAWIGVVMIHELGHLAGARLAGLRAVACGLGVYRPWLWFQFRGVTFYLGRPITSGITQIVSETPILGRNKELLMIAAGPIASALFGLGAALIWYSGLHWNSVAALFWASVFAVAATSIPFQADVGPTRLANDCSHIIRLLRHRSRAGEMDPAAQMETCRVLAGTFQRTQCLLGEIAYTISLAALQASLRDPESALQTLEAPCLRDPMRNDWGRALERIVRAESLAVTGSPEGQESLLQLEERPPTDSVLALIARYARLHLTQPTVEPRAGPFLTIMEEARLLEVHDLERMAEVSALLAEPPGDLDAAAKKILAQGKLRRMSRTERLRLGTGVAQVLAERGDAKDAEFWLQDARRLQLEIAASIRDKTTRERFRERTTVDLRRILDALPETAEIGVVAAAVRQPRSELASLIQLAVLVGVFAFVAIAVKQREGAAVAVGKLAPISVSISLAGLALSIAGLGKKVTRVTAAWSIPVQCLLLIGGVPHVFSSEQKRSPSPLFEVRYLTTTRQYDAALHRLGIEMNRTQPGFVKSALDRAELQLLKAGILVEAGREDQGANEYLAAAQMYAALPFAVPDYYAFTPAVDLLNRQRRTADADWLRGQLKKWFKDSPAAE